MGADDPKDIDRAAIEAHAQHLVEQTALRKVRKTLDEIKQAETGERRLLRKLLLACAIVAVLGIGFFAWLMLGGKGLPKEPPMKVPGATQAKP